MCFLILPKSCKILVYPNKLKLVNLLTETCHMFTYFFHLKKFCFQYLILASLEYGFLECYIGLAKIFQVGSNRILHKDCLNKRISICFLQNLFWIFIIKRYFLAFPYPKLTLARLNSDPSLPVSSLPSSVSVSVASAQASSKRDTFIYYQKEPIWLVLKCLTSVRKSSQTPLCYICMIIIWLTFNKLYHTASPT